VTRAPDVTVVIPTHNRWPLLNAHGLQSALAQEGVAFEVVVVDDGSRDGTAERVAELDDERVRLLRRGTSGGPSSARNLGIAAARAPWVAFLDDDDLWAPRKLQAQLTAAAAAQADWVYAGSVNVDERGAVLARPELADATRLGELLLQRNVMSGGCSTVVARSALLKQVGGFDESLDCFEDWDLWIRLAQNGTAVAVDAILVACMVHSGSSSLDSGRKILEQHERMLTKHRAVMPADRRAVLEWLAGEQARAGRRLRAGRLYTTAAFRNRSLGNLAAAAGAVFGARGLAAAARLHMRLRGRTHVGPQEPPPPPDLPWLNQRRLDAG
jgi:GT2 family glycosyltransferase